MLTQIIQYLQVQIAALPFLEEVNGLAQIVSQNSDGQNIFFPAFYKNEELHTLNFDTRRTQLFFLADGEIERDTIENPLVACAYRIHEAYPLKAILYKQGKEDVNCKSESQQIAWNISKTITGKQKGLMDSTGIDFVLMTVTGTQLDKHLVWKQLYSATDSLKDGDILIAVRFKVEIEGDEACFVPNPCTLS